MEPIQILLFAVVALLTVLLVVVGVQVFLVLKDARKSLKKVNRILEDANMVSSSVARPIAGVANFVESFKSIKNLVGLVSGKKKSRKKKAVVVQNGDGSDQKVKSLQERGRRFYKGGKPLSS